MRLLYFAVALLWMLFATLLFAVVAVAFSASMSASEKAVSIGVLALLITPVALQIRASHRQVREMTENRVLVTAEGIDLRLGGHAREWKGLAEIEDTHLSWDEVQSITKERRRFVYPSVIALGYPLDVYTLRCRAREFEFTRECVRNARRVAQEIRAKVGGEL